MKYKAFILLLTTSIVVIGGVLLLQRSQSSTDWIWQVSQGGTLLWPLLVASALIDSINPCSFSILLVSIIFLFTIGRTKQSILRYGLVYILGIFLAYLFIGLGLLQALHIFDIPHFMSKVGAGALVIFGLINILETIFPKFPIKLAVPHKAHMTMNELVKKVSFPAMLGLGLLVGLCEFPCTGGPYLVVLGLLHDTKTYWQGVGYLFAYNLLFIIPLLLILLVSSNQVVVEHVQRVQKSNSKMLKIIAGLLMIVLAYIILYI